jgi:hypothetical protein
MEIPPWTQLPVRVRSAGGCPCVPGPLEAVNHDGLSWPLPSALCLKAVAVPWRALKVGYDTADGG